MMELLAPGGSYAGLIAAVNAGADAIYMGGQRFGARAYADNPEGNDLLRAMDYCHLHGRKLYLTVNTLLKQRELEGELYEYLLPLYEHGLDAVLVQDFGVFQFIRRNFPGLPLHASTQMTITGAGGARLLKRMGAERIVVSRELTLEEIRTIHREVDIEIESFVHGALCYCYSGQCLMSSLIGGRSGNRGRCAQPCRLPYEAYQGEKRLDRGQGSCLLSLKDICTLSLLPELARAGVCSFKIEGRMKRPEYAAGVTEIYRKYMDRYEKYGTEGYRVDPEDEQALMDLYNRGGFSKGYYQMYNSREMMSMQRPNHQGTAAARVTGLGNGQLKLKALEPLWSGDSLELPGSGSGKKSAGELVLKADVPSGREFSIQGDTRKLKLKQTLYRMRCERQLQRLRESYTEREIPEKIKGNFILNAENPAILTVIWKDTKITVLGERPSLAEKHPLEEETVRRQLLKTGNTPFVFETLKVELADGLFYPMQGLNELRRNALEQLRCEILKTYIRETKNETEKKPAENFTENAEHEDREFAEKMAPSVYSENSEKMTTQTTSANIDSITERNGNNALPETPKEPKKPKELKKTEPSVRPIFLASVETEEQLLALCDIPEIAGIYLDCYLFMENASGKMNFTETVELLHRKTKRAYLMLPVIWRENGARAFETVFHQGELEAADGFLIRSIEQLDRLICFAGKKEIIADAGIYTYNREARSFLVSTGVTRDTLPLECNRGELRERGCQGSECIIYGYLPLMYTAQCLMKNTAGCQKQPGILYLKDRKQARFPVRNHCSCCTNVIYNSVPLDLLPEAGEVLGLSPYSCRMAFTFENREETQRIARTMLRQFERGRTRAEGCPGSTRGHFKRGVE